MNASIRSFCCVSSSVSSLGSLLCPPSPSLFHSSTSDRPDTGAIGSTTRPSDWSVSSPRLVDPPPVLPAWNRDLVRRFLRKGRMPWRRRPGCGPESMARGQRKRISTASRTKRRARASSATHRCETGWLQRRGTPKWAETSQEIPCRNVQAKGASQAQGETSRRVRITMEWWHVLTIRAGCRSQNEGREPRRTSSCVPRAGMDPEKASRQGCRPSVGQPWQSSP